MISGHSFIFDEKKVNAYMMLEDNFYPAVLKNFGYSATGAYLVFSDFVRLGFVKKTGNCFNFTRIGKEIQDNLKNIDRLLRV